MQSMFYVSHLEQQLGPFSVDEIVQKVSQNHLGVTDFLYDEVKQDWIMIMEHPSVMDALGSKKPKAPPPKAQNSEPAQTAAAAEEIASTTHTGDDANQGTTEWFILKGENKFGPFTYTDLVKMLQDKVVFEFDYVWHAGLSTWRRMAEMQEFSPDSIKNLKETKMPEISEVFFRRRYKRASWGGSILVHDNKTVWKGEGIEISAGGAGLYMENAMLVPGQTLYLHFKPGDGVPPFNAICEVVSKKFLKELSDRKAPIKYGVKFTSIAPNTQQLLQDYTNRTKVAA